MKVTIVYMKLEMQGNFFWEQTQYHKLEGCSYCNETLTLKETMTSIKDISVYIFINASETNVLTSDQ